MVPVECLFWKRLGDDVSDLILGCNGSDVPSHMGSEEVMSLVDVFCPRMVLWIVCNLQSTTVVLEDSAMDLCRSGVDGVPKLLHFFRGGVNPSLTVSIETACPRPKGDFTRPIHTWWKKRRRTLHNER